MSVPVLRFPEFEGEWDEKRLKDFAPLQRGFDLPTTQVKDGTFPVVYSNGILRKHIEYRVKGPGVVTGRSGTIGKVHFVAEDFWPHNTSLWVTNFFENVPAFVYQFYANLRLEKIGTGSGVPTLNRNDVHALKRNLPKPAEQKKIAAFLGVVDARIAALRDRVVGLERYKRGLMQALFSQSLRFTKPDGTPFPDWEEKRLGDFGDFKNGFNATKEAFGSGGPFVNLMDIFGIPTIGEPPNGLVETTKKDVEQYSVLKGDVLFVRSSVKRTGVGQACLVVEDLPNTVYSGFILRFRQNEAGIEHAFRQYCFSSQAFRKQVLAVATSSANTNVNQENLRELKVRLPDPDEQAKIAEALQAMDAKIVAVRGQVDKMEAFKKGLLQQMFV